MNATAILSSPYFTEEHQMIRDQLARFVEREVVPHGEAWEEAGQIPREPLKMLGEMGILGIRVPEEYGGSGLDIMASVAMAEELARSTFGGFTITVLVHTDMASPHLVRYGTEEQKERWLPGIVSGDIITAIGVTEPGAGSDVAGLRTRAVRDGDHYILNGAKTFITNAAHGDLVFVAARTDPDMIGSQGISVFGVEAGTPGFNVSRKLKKTGWLCSDTSELTFEDCRVPASAIIGGQPGVGFATVMKCLNKQRINLAALSTGPAIRMLDD